jgi:hypothetical protein
MSEQNISHNTIAALATELWIKAGQPEGRDLDFWLEAEKKLQSVSGHQLAISSSTAESGLGTAVQRPQPAAVRSRKSKAPRH